MHCGKELVDDAVVCISCGRQVSNYTEVNAKSASGNVWWAFLSAIIPLVGLILYIVWNASKPQEAKLSGIGAIIGVFFRVVFLIVLITVIYSYPQYYYYYC